MAEKSWSFERLRETFNRWKEGLEQRKTERILSIFCDGITECPQCGADERRGETHEPSCPKRT
jgi:hypothetical protein